MCQGLARQGTGKKYECFCKICGSKTQKSQPPKGGVVCSDACLRESRRRNGNQLAKDGKAVPPKQTAEMRLAASIRMTGPNCPKWNGGKTTGGNGKYILVAAPADYPFPSSISTRGYIREHRMVMELHLGRPLLKTEVIHHVNGIPTDNRIENLQVMTQSEHMRIEGEEGTFHKRWKRCIMDCGRGTKPFQKGTHFKVCSKCKKADPTNPLNMDMW